MTLASIYELELRFDDAIAIYESLLDGNADVLVAKNNLASLLTDHRGDEASLERARTLSAVFRDSRVPQFRDTYAWALVRSNKNIEEAVAILKKIVKDNDSVGVYKFHLGEAYREMGEIENARSTLGLAMRQLTPESRLAEQAKAALAELN
jgi:tetratricopeptide (TPR) repeat protein